MTGVDARRIVTVAFLFSALAIAATDRVMPSPHGSDGH